MFFFLLFTHLADNVHKNSHNTCLIQKDIIMIFNVAYFDHSIGNVVGFDFLI